MKTLCCHAGCYVAFEGSGNYCNKHKKVADKSKRKEEPDRRNLDIYNSGWWRNLSKQHRQQYPICERCNRKLAEEVDHHLEISLDPQREFTRDPDNLVSVCKSCHYEKGNNIKRLIKKGNINEIRNWLVSNHPRPADTDYIKVAEIALESL